MKVVRLFFCYLSFFLLMNYISNNLERTNSKVSCPLIRDEMNSRLRLNIILISYALLQMSILFTRLLVAILVIFAGLAISCV